MLSRHHHDHRHHHKYAVALAAAATITPFTPIAAPTATAAVPVHISVDAQQALNPATPSTIGLHTSVYANNFNNPTLPGLIADSGVDMLRFPGGSYSDIYNWSVHGSVPGGYTAYGSDFGNFVNVLDNAGTDAMVTVNYGSSHQGTMGGQPKEAAAWVAYANGSVGNTQPIGVDDEGNNWHDVDYWARLRASTPGEYDQWAKPQGRYNPDHSFLAIDRDEPVGITYWEIGNEIGGNGYWGAQWEYDRHAPFHNNDQYDNTGRVGNPLLSPTAYATNSLDFIAQMKAVDPTIKIGLGLDEPPTGNPADAHASNQQVLSVAGDAMDFAILHWYVDNGNGPDRNARLRDAVRTDLAPRIQTVHDDFAAYTNKQPGDYEVHFTEFGYFGSTTHGSYDAFFVADTYATLLSMGVSSAHFLEMTVPEYLGDTPPTPGEAYRAVQMVDTLTEDAAQWVNADSDVPNIRAHATRLANGDLAVMVINWNAGDVTQDAQVTLDLAGFSPDLTRAATLNLYGWDEVAANAGITPGTLTLTGTTLHFTVPDVAIATLVIPTAIPQPLSLAAALIATPMALGRRRSSR